MKKDKLEKEISRIIPWYKKYQVSVPEGESGDWRIEKYTVNDTSDKVAQLSSMFHYGRYVPAGTYTRLVQKGVGIVMSDTPDEISDQLHFISQAKGKILIAGLGLGVTVNAVAQKPEVDYLIVIEKSKDVINLVAEYYLKKFPEKLQIIQADIFTWKTDQYFDYAWYDIWATLCTDHLKEMGTLHRRFGRKTKWQDSWGKSFLQAERRRNRYSLY